MPLSIRLELTAECDRCNRSTVFDGIDVDGRVTKPKLLAAFRKAGWSQDRSGDVTCDKCSNPETVKRQRLTDRQCRVFLKSMQDFGYNKLTFERVREIADQVADGTHSVENVIAVIMASQIDAAKHTLGRS